MDLFGGSVTAEFPYGKDKSGLARYLDTGLLVYAALDGECDDPDYIDAAFCADCVAAGIQICKGCGCTDQVGCAGGCYWAEDNLCSQCVPAKTDDFSDPECTACHQRRARPGLTVCQPCLEAQREAVLA